MSKLKRQKDYKHTISPQFLLLKTPTTHLLLTYCFDEEKMGWGRVKEDFVGL